MRKKRIKKNIQFLVLVLFILGLAFSVFTYTKNELRFKYFNRVGIGEKNSVEKEKYFHLAMLNKPEWALVTKSNKLDILYQEKKYEELKKKIDDIENNECSLNKKETSEFCENVFYLGGLVEYRLGQKDKEKEEEFNKKAIFEFQKTLDVNLKNIWAKENIEFLLKKNQELKKQKEEPKQKQGKGQDKKDDKNQNGKSGKDGEKHKQDQKNGQGKNNKENQKNEKRKGDEQKGQKGQSEKENKKNKENGINSKSSQNQNNQAGKKLENKNNQNQNGGKSRLPSQIQRALEQQQKKLDQEQKNQKGFARTKSKAERNKQLNHNPFSAFQNDPFFKDFFGNDPFFNQAFNQQKNLRRDLGGGEDVKDW